MPSAAATARQRMSLQKGLHDTLHLAKTRGHLVHSVNAALVRDQFSNFFLLRALVFSALTSKFSYYDRVLVIVRDH